MTHAPEIFTQISKGLADPDFGIRPGDLITAYHKGYHRVTGIQRRFFDKKPTTSWVTYTQILTIDGKESPKRKRDGDASHCTIVTIDDLEKERIIAIKSTNDRIDTLIALVKGI